VSYERLEFLGDSVLELAVAHALYERHPDFLEGRLTKARAYVVSRATCAEVARELGIDTRLAARAPDEPTREEIERLVQTPSVVGAVLEAALGALFLEHGFAAIEEAVVGAFSVKIDQSVTELIDPKTELQELLFPRHRKITYAEISSEGPAHDRLFTCAVLVDDEEFGRGEGRTKKGAEQEAAREALAKLDAARADSDS
jgi:ribonuclease III